MATGNKKNNVSVIDGTSFQDAYNITDATTVANLEVLRLNGSAKEKCIAWWDSATAFSVAAKTACKGMPKGAIVYDVQAKITWLKTGDRNVDQWSYSAANT